jgi:hypothetical protein
MKMGIRALACLAVVSVFIVPSPAGAANRDLGFHGWGPHAGFSFTPDQFFFGAHFDLGDFVPHVQFQPSVDLGLGDDLTFFSLNPDIVYNFETGGAASFYLGGIFALQYWKVDNVPSEIDDSETNIGIHALGGLKLKDQPVHFQVEIGLNTDAPDWKFSGGYTFEH